MTVTLSYDATLSRVRLSATGLGSATAAVVERSTDQVSWSTVRGGAAVPVVSSTMALDDYEFEADTTCYYRVTVPSDISFVAAGTEAHGNNASVVPGLPTGAAAGDLLLIWAAIRNSGAGTPDTPAGYTLLLDMSNARLFGKIHSGSESAPTVSFTGGVANADTSAQMAAFRGVPAAVVASAQQLNGSAQNIATPSLSHEAVDSALVLWPAWKQDDWTSVAVVAAGIEIGEPSTTTGDDQGIVWDYRILTTTTTAVGARTFTVTGGAAAISRGGVTVLRASRSIQTNSITPSLSGQPWLKSITRPFLNMPIVSVLRGGEQFVTARGSRQGVFEVIGRSLPVARTDVRANFQFTLRVYAETEEEQDRVGLVLDSGDPVFLHVPPGSPVKSMYLALGDAEFNHRIGVYTIAVRRVAAPGPDVVGATSTWQTVVNTYATWADVIAANATWADLLELVGDPSEVIVP